MDDDGVLMLPPRPLRAVGCTNGTIAIYDERSCAVCLKWPDFDDDADD